MFCLGEIFIDGTFLHSSCTEYKSKDTFVINLKKRNCYILYCCIWLSLHYLVVWHIKLQNVFESDLHISGQVVSWHVMTVILTGSVCWYCFKAKIANIQRFCFSMNVSVLVTFNFQMFLFIVLCVARSQRTCWTSGGCTLRRS